MKRDTKAALGILAIGGLILLGSKVKGAWNLDPDIVKEPSPLQGFKRFRSLGGLGHRIWIGSAINGRTVTITVSVPNDSLNTASIEMNNSYGWSYLVSPGTEATLISTATAINEPPGRRIAPSEQPDQPFARANQGELSVWFHSGVVDVRIKIG